MEDKDRKRGLRRAHMNRFRKVANRKIAKEMAEDENLNRRGEPYHCYTTTTEIRDLNVRFKLNGCRPEKTWVQSCDCYCERKKGECDECKRWSRWKSGELRMNDEYHEWQLMA